MVRSSMCPRPRTAHARARGAFDLNLMLFMIGLEYTDSASPGSHVVTLGHAPARHHVLTLTYCPTYRPKVRYPPFEPVCTRWGAH